MRLGNISRWLRLVTNMLRFKGNAGCRDYEYEEHVRQGSGFLACRAAGHMLEYVLVGAVLLVLVTPAVLSLQGALQNLFAQQAEVIAWATSTPAPTPTATSEPHTWRFFVPIGKECHDREDGCGCTPAVGDGCVELAYYWWNEDHWEHHGQSPNYGYYNVQYSAVVNHPGPLRWRIVVGYIPPGMDHYNKEGCSLGEVCSCLYAWGEEGWSAIDCNTVESPLLAADNPEWQPYGETEAYFYLTGTCP